MKPESQNLTRITGAATGTGLAVGSENDWLQIIGIILATISTLAPLLQNLINKRRNSGGDGTNLLLALFTSSLLAALCLATGCAQFTTTQTDLSYDHGQPTRAITTKASALTLWESRSALANFKASQTDKTQSATVGALNQESGGTNTAATVQAVTELLKTLK